MVVEQAVSGPVLFARYAFPPNQRGYCGPSDAAGFFAQAANGDNDGLRRQARDFDGALPHLELIAAATEIDDPLDPRVVEAYWLGGPELERVAGHAVADAVEQQWRGRSGPVYVGVRTALAAGARPHHSFTVLCVYPWVAMLGDPRRTPQAMVVLDRCRIRWGRVLDTDGDTLRVESTPLVWTGDRLALGAPVVEPARRAIDGIGLSEPLTPGDTVALHWDWVCDRITGAQQQALQGYTGRHIDLVNDWLVDRG